MNAKHRIRELLDAGKHLTNLTAYHEVGTLDARKYISRLRQENYPVKTEMITVKNRFQEPVRIAQWSKA